MPFEETSADMADVTPTFAHLSEIKNELIRLRNKMTPVLSSMPKSEKMSGKPPAATGLLAEIDEILAMAQALNDDFYL